LACAALTTTIACTGLTGCVQPHCTTPSYGDAECRVIAENELARLRTADGVELRFSDPDARDDSTWDARGLLEQLDDGTVLARVAGAGRFALSMRATADTELDLRLTNVDAAATITVGPLDAGTALPSPSGSRLDLSATLSADEVQWVRGDRPCPSRYRIAVTGDIQTNPTQFERIVDHLQQDIEDSAETDRQLVAVLVVGDLTEASRDDEFTTISEILGRLPIPVAVTPGNHDIFRPARAHYNRVFGPGNYAFDVCGVHVAMLDSGSGAIARSVQARLPQLLDRNGAQFLIAGMHHPPYAGLTGAGWSREDLAAALLVELARERANLIVAGHNHALRDYPDIPVGDVDLREIIVGTGGANQGAGIPRYGYLRLEFDDDAGTIDSCFAEVPPVGYASPPNDPPADTLPHCPDP
ncbi:MAG: metallophosphoesterase, partial [Deltaproteobacteria bacterium]|nr:metallophosphoesterase [Deltaproteobacteria bacterium]